MSIEISQDLIEIRAESALEVFTKPGGIEPYLNKIRVQLDAFVPIVDTEAGRAEIKSIAHKVSKSKAYLEGIGKKLADEQKAIPKKIDEARRLLNDTLDRWRDEVRKPVTDFENAEKARVEKHSVAISSLRKEGEILPNLRSGDIRDRLGRADAVQVSPEACDEFEAEYLLAKTNTLATLRAALESAEKLEAEQEELARLRVEKAARDAEEARARAEREAAEKAVAAERIRQETQAKAEEDRKNKHEFALQSIQGMISDAASPMNDSGMIQHISKLFETMSEHKRDWQEYRARYDKIVTDGRKLITDRLAFVQKHEEERRQAQKAQEESDRRAREAEAKVAELKCQEEARKAEAEAREANKQHCAKVNSAAVKALVAGGLSEDVARVVVTLIAKRQIPSVTISY